MENNTVKKVIEFLQLFMPQTLAKRIASIILIAAGIPNKQVTELTGVCDRSVRTLRKALDNGEIAGLFHVGGGGGRSKLADVEKEIIEEITATIITAFSKLLIWRWKNTKSRFPSIQSEDC